MMLPSGDIFGQLEELSLSYYLLITMGNIWINAFLQGISVKWNKNSLACDVNSGWRLHFLRQ